MATEDDEEPKRILDARVQLTDWDSQQANRALARASDEFFSIAFTSEVERKVWLTVVAVASELEWFAARILWVREGKRGEFDDFCVGSLFKAARNLKGDLPQRTAEILQRIANLRNAVAHRTLTGFGVRAPDWRKVGYEVNGETLNVFVFPVAFERLLRDALEARAEMLEWLHRSDS